MKKSAKGEVVLSACQIHATHLNRLEQRRLQRDITSLKEDLETHIARIQRQEQGLRYHFTNVVRVVKPNRAYQAWKQAHANEIAKDEAQDLIETIKLKHRTNSIIRKKATPASIVSSVSLKESSTKTFRPLLLLLEPENDKSQDVTFNLTEDIFRPKTSPNHPKRVDSSRRVNPLLNMLHGRPTSSTNQSRQQSSFDISSNYSFSSGGTASGRKLKQGKHVSDHNQADLDALYRIALQNQTAYKQVEHKRIEDRKLHDKDFASEHRALKGRMKSAAVSHKIE